ncbi:MAG: hypothetical protein V8Q84_09890 [Bilophila sp.]
MNDTPLRLNGMVRLLHTGARAATPQREPVAEPLSPAQAAASPALEGPARPLTAVPPAESGDAPFLEQLFQPDPAAERRDAETIRLPAPLYLAGQATSSMDVARSLALGGQLPVWGSVLTLCQTSGRGQLGRHWVSPEGNVYAALRLPCRHPFTDTAAAPALGGLIAESLSGSVIPCA